MSGLLAQSLLPLKALFVSGLQTPPSSLAPIYKATSLPQPAFWLQPPQALSDAISPFPRTGVSKQQSREEKRFSESQPPLDPTLSLGLAQLGIFHRGDPRPSGRRWKKAKFINSPWDHGQQGQEGLTWPTSSCPTPALCHVPFLGLE